MARSAIFWALVLTAGASSETDQTAALNAIREYALNYTKRLPNFTCSQITRQNIVREQFGRSIPGTELIEEQVSYLDNKEIRRVSRINGGPAAPDGGDQHRGTLSRGEFGYLLATIFDPATGADIRWDRMATLNRRRVYVFAFHVPQSNGYTLTESKRTLRVPFEGFVYADYATRQLVRVEMKCTHIPRDSEYLNAGLTLDYKLAKVAGQEFILPAHYMLHFQMVRGFVTNDAEYTNYRRFSADATIQFEGEPR